MNTKIKILAASLIVVIALIGILQIFMSKPPQTDAYSSCTLASDCVVVKGDCCGCNYGGTASSVNKEFETQWNSQLLEECQDRACPAVISNHPSCFKVPSCIKNKCVLGNTW